jgi:hypothetical protein
MSTAISSCSYSAAPAIFLKLVTADENDSAGRHNSGNEATFAAAFLLGLFEYKLA